MMEFFYGLCTVNLKILRLRNVIREHDQRESECIVVSCKNKWLVHTKIVMQL